MESTLRGMTVDRGRIHDGEARDVASRPFLCRWDRCGERTISSSHMLEHLKTHVGTGKHVYICEVSEGAERTSGSREYERVVWRRSGGHVGAGCVDCAGQIGRSIDRADTRL
jgi:hypothetical protein